MIEELLSEGNDFAFLFINMDTERFRDCFSKYEMTTGLELISRAVSDKGIPVFSVNTDVSNSVYNAPISASSNGPADIPVKSSYDDQFQKQFNDLVKFIPEPLNADFYDVFQSDSLKKRIRESGIRKLLICGFDSEKDILASVIGCVREGFVPILLSDCISSRSERVFFEVLNVLSRWSVVGDTRDLTKLWEMW